MSERPQDVPTDTPVSLICMGALPGRVIQGTVQRCDEGSYELEIADGDVDVDEKVVLDFSRNDLPLVHARVVRREGSRLHLEVLESHARDPREFPRMAAGVHMRYLREASDETGDAWLAGGDEPEGAWREPDPLMDFSASGLAFEDTQACAEGERLLLELRNPAGDETWRALGRVVRAGAIGMTWKISLTLEGLPPEATQALLEYTIALQERALGDEGPSAE